MPRKPNPEDARTETLRFRVSVAERQRLEAEADAAGLDLTSLLRMRALKPTLIITVPQEATSPAPRPEVEPAGITQADVDSGLVELADPNEPPTYVRVVDPLTIPGVRRATEPMDLDDPEPRVWSKAAQKAGEKFMEAVKAIDGYACEPETAVGVLNNVIAKVDGAQKVRDEVIWWIVEHHPEAVPEEWK